VLGRADRGPGPLRLIQFAWLLSERRRPLLGQRSQGAGDQVAVSFVKWQRAERLKFKAHLRALMRSGTVTPPRSRSFGQWRKAHVAPLAGAALVGIALGFAFDLLERDQTGQVQANVIPQPASAESTGPTVV
jgi:hypothetical protein